MVAKNDRLTQQVLEGQELEKRYRSERNAAKAENVKLKKSYCPPGEVAGNPCLEYVKYVVMPWCGKFSVTRAEDNGGDKDYVEYEEVEKDFGTIAKGKYADFLVLDGDPLKDIGVFRAENSIQMVMKGGIAYVDNLLTQDDKTVSN